MRSGLGRSHGGLSTKIHLVADRRCRPIARIISPGQHGDSPRFIPLFERVRIARRNGPPTHPAHRRIGGQAYPSKANRTYLRRRGIVAVIPVKKDQAVNRAELGRRRGSLMSTFTATPSTSAHHWAEASGSSAKTITARRVERRDRDGRQGKGGGPARNPKTHGF
jgi:Transposase DDE domain